MGQTYSFHCKDCGHKQDLYEGWGFMVHNKPASSYLSEKKLRFHYKTHRKIKELSRTHKDLQLQMEFRIYRCKKCLQIFDKLDVKVMDNETVLHEPEFKCPTCNLRLKHTNIHRLKYAICPKCKSTRFKKDHELVLW